MGILFINEPWHYIHFLVYGSIFVTWYKGFDSIPHKICTLFWSLLSCLYYEPQSNAVSHLLGCKPRISPARGIQAYLQAQWSLQFRHVIFQVVHPKHFLQHVTTSSLPDDVFQTGWWNLENSWGILRRKFDNIRTWCCPIEVNESVVWENYIYIYINIGITMLNVISWDFEKVNYCYVYLISLQCILGLLTLNTFEIWRQCV